MAVGWSSVGVGFGGTGFYGTGSGLYDNYLVHLEQQNRLLQQQVLALQAEPKAPDNEAPVRLVANPPRVDRNAQVRNHQAARQQQLIDSGTKLFEAGIYGRASDRFRSAARLSERDGTPYYLLAQSLFASKDYSASANALKTALEIQPAWLGSFDIRRLYPDEITWRDQLGDLAATIQAQPLNRDALFVLGYELFAGGEVEKAKAILEQVSRLAPDDCYLQPILQRIDAQAEPEKDKI